MLSNNVEVVCAQIQLKLAQLLEVAGTDLNDISKCASGCSYSEALEAKIRLTGVTLNIDFGFYDYKHGDDDRSDGGGGTTYSWGRHNVVNLHATCPPHIDLQLPIESLSH